MIKSYTILCDEVGQFWDINDQNPYGIGWIVVPTFYLNKLELELSSRRLENVHFKNIRTVKRKILKITQLVEVLTKIPGAFCGAFVECDYGYSQQLYNNILGDAKKQGWHGGRKRFSRIMRMIHLYSAAVRYPLLFVRDRKSLRDFRFHFKLGVTGQKDTYLEDFELVKESLVNELDNSINNEFNPHKLMWDLKVHNITFESIDSTACYNAFCYADMLAYIGHSIALQKKGHVEMEAEVRQILKHGNSAGIVVKNTLSKSSLDI